MALGHLRIENTGPIGSASVKHWHIYIDGHDITNVVRGIEIRASVSDGVPHVLLDCIASVEFPSDLGAYMTVEKTEIVGGWGGLFRRTLKGIRWAIADVTTIGDKYRQRRSVS